MRKRIFNAESGDWTADLDALIEEGEFVNNKFVYSIELIPRGNYGEAFPVSVFTREDTLPDALDFVGFVSVDGSGVPNLEKVSTDPVLMQGNIDAVYADGVVTISQRTGTSLNPNDGRIVVFFVVEANDASGPIVNSIAGSETTITPVGDPSIDIEKWNDEDSAPEYDVNGALQNDGFAGDFDETPGKPLAADTPLPINFTISNDGREQLVDVVVSDELTDGKGEIADLVCVFPDGSEGTEWAGPFEIGTQFDCTGTLPALAVGDTHANLSQVTGVGIKSNKNVDDEDPWNVYVPTPSIDIEKWNDEGETPEYDEFGALLNDGFEGDFDKAPGKSLNVGKELAINFTVSNDGEEPLVDVVVSDELTDGKGKITDLVCVFPDDSEGTEWAGPFEVGTQFECSGTLPALAADQKHSDRATVTGVGLYSGTGVDDEDDWFGFTPKPDAPLSNTGSELPIWAGIGGLTLLLAGGAMMLIRRKRATS